MIPYHYPTDWRALAAEIKAANGWCCQACNKQCQRPGELRLGWQYQLTVAHITQDYLAAVVQLAPLCVLCHFRHDAPFVWQARRRHERYRQQVRGQLTLFETVVATS